MGKKIVSFFVEGTRMMQDNNFKAGPKELCHPCYTTEAQDAHSYEHDQQVLCKLVDFMQLEHCCH